MPYKCEWDKFKKQTGKFHFTFYMDCERCEQNSACGPMVPVH